MIVELRIWLIVTCCFFTLLLPLWYYLAFSSSHWGLLCSLTNGQKKETKKKSTRSIEINCKKRRRADRLDRREEVAELDNHSHWEWNELFSHWLMKDDGHIHENWTRNEAILFSTNIESFTRRNLCWHTKGFFQWRRLKWKRSVIISRVTLREISRETRTPTKNMSTAHSLPFLYNNQMNDSTSLPSQINPFLLLLLLLRIVRRSEEEFLHNSFQFNHWANSSRNPICGPVQASSLFNKSFLKKMSQRDERILINPTTDNRSNTPIIVKKTSVSTMFISLSLRSIFVLFSDVSSEIIKIISVTIIME